MAPFEQQTGIHVAYTNAPYAQYRETMITKFTGGAPVDVLWVSDSWLPEFAEAGWIVPVDGYPQLMAYDAETSDFCVKSMTYKGKQYGLTYYTDYMSFLYDAELLAKAGIAAPPASWAEVTEQAKAIKARGLSDFPVAIGLAQETYNCRARRTAPPADAANSAHTGWSRTHTRSAPASPRSAP